MLAVVHHILLLYLNFEIDEKIFPHSFNAIS